MRLKGKLVSCKYVFIFSEAGLVLDVYRVTK